MIRRLDLDGVADQLAAADSGLESSSDHKCVHCGLPVPAFRLDDPEEARFCCQGCQTAWQLIHEGGLDAWYSMRETPGEEALSGPVKAFADSEWELFDDETLQARIVERRGAISITTLAIGGMHCAACIWLLEKLPRLVQGVRRTSVNWGRQTIRIEWETGRVRLSRITSMLATLGYPAALVGSGSRNEARNRENRQHAARIGMAGASAGNNMLIAAALYLGMFEHMSHDIEWLLRGASCLLGVFSLVVPGRVFIANAVAALRTRTPHMDLPIALGLVAGTVSGVVNTIRGSGEIWFDSLSVLIFVLLIGRWIRFRQQNQAADAIEMLYRLTPQRARKLSGDQCQIVPAESLLPDDRVEVLPGELIPADGRIESGSSHLDEQILTGEATPVVRATNDSVLAGTRNIDSRLVVVATGTGLSTRIAQISRLVQEASEGRPPIVEWANRIGNYFVVLIIVLAAATFAAWMSIRPEIAVDRAVALLVVACPCALAMATPLAISVALGRLARSGILVKSGDVIQHLSQPGTIWLDKTGTLTEGRMKVIRWEGSDHWKRYVSAMEKGLSHPVAQALAMMSQEPGSSRESLPVVEGLHATSDGVSATVEGRKVLAGNARFIESHSIAIPASLARIALELAEQQLSPCWIGIDGEIVALAGIGDSIRLEATAILNQLRAQGWRCGILSGDHPAIVASVARRLGGEFVAVRAEVSPEEKLLVVGSDSRGCGPVVMVGDGVNDSAALARATVGIAVRGGAEASLAAAPVYFSRPGLEPLVQLIQCSRSACRTIRVNLFVSVMYNIAGAVLAAAGIINPLIAAILMPASSLTVTALSLRSGNCAGLASSQLKLSDRTVVD
jgi:P-type Cu2+ transporter